MALPDPVRVDDWGLRRDHGVQFYYNVQILAEAVVEFIGNGLLADQPVLVIASAVHRRLFTDVLFSQAFDVDRVVASGELAWLDAHETLATFMDGAVPNAERFMQHVGGAIEAIGAGRSGVIRAFGEMVDILWRAGMPESALRVEELWNILAEQRSFSLLCAYGLGNFYKETMGPQYRQVCDVHRHVIAADHPDLMTDERRRSRRTRLLEQRAQALEYEIKQCERLQQTLKARLTD